MNNEEFLKLVARGTTEIISLKELEKKLLSNKKLIVKFGADPTASDLHLGHTLPIQKLKLFQDMGHEIAFIIGDFTAMIGDPTGRSILRKPLSRDEVMKNSETYVDQVFKILDKNKTKIYYNSEWLSKMGIEKFLELSSKYTVARMLERDDFYKRYKSNTPISIVEFLYPLMQGYDSIVVKADVEIGGNDQKFNLLVGRELQKDYGLDEQVVITLPLLVGLDGIKKMSKSYGNYVGINEDPNDMYGKIMSVSDETMMKYYEILTDENLDLLKEEHPKILKENLAKIIIKRFHKDIDLEKIKENFDKVFKLKDLPDEIKEFFIEKGECFLEEILFNAGLVNSKNEATRLLRENAVKLNQEKIEYKIRIKFNLKDGDILQVGKRKFVKIRIKC